MGPDDKQLFGIAMGIMAEAFQKRPSDTMTEIYWKILQDMIIEDFERASLSIINTRKITGTFPLVAEIREAANTLMPLDTRAALAWDKFIYALRHHHPYDSVAFDDPIIAHIILVWGDWPSMGEWPENKTQWWRREFMMLYQAYAKSNTLPEAPPYLVGLHEYENSRTGWLDFIPKPVLISGEHGQIKVRPLGPPALKLAAR